MPPLTSTTTTDAVDLQIAGELALGRFSSFPSSGGVDVFCSTRTGGVSPAPYASLNLGTHVGDDPGNVVENRRRLLAAAGSSLDRSVWCRQVHEATVTVVTSADAGRGARSDADGVDGTDALVTDVPGLTLLAMVADCVPVVVADPVRGAVGVAHAGWRGTVAHVTRRTVEVMVGHLGCRPDDLVAAVGPSIGPEEYEVGPEVVAQADAAYPGIELIRPAADPAKGFFDLWAANRADLLDAGVRPERIEVAARSTISEPDLFFSARGAPDPTGRFALGATILRR